MLPQEAFTVAFCTQQENSRIDLIVFLTKRICCFARLSMGASPAHRLFWQGQMTAYHKALRQAMTNPIFRGGEQ